MSRSGRATGASKQDSGVCPVCKASGYLDPNMQFKINPTCYHSMCDTCVERLFGGNKGNNICPVAGCAKTLAYRNFRRATFEDLKVEREVDLRKKVMKIMNKTEDDFETLRDYNDYLEKVEEMTWNLILNIDVDATWNKLHRFEALQKADSNAATTKRDAGKTGVAKSAGQKDDGADLMFHGLKKYVPPPKEPPFDPWGGYNIAPQYYVLQDNYHVDWYARMKKDSAHLVGGHSLQDYCDRALREAFGGFGVFIEDEIAARDAPSMSMDADVGTEHAAAAAMSGKEANMDDIF